MHCIGHQVCKLLTKAEENEESIRESKVVVLFWWLFLS